MDDGFQGLLDAWPEDDLGPTFLTSYSFNAPFFESAILPTLLGRGAHPLVVFVDRQSGFMPALQLLSLLRGAGVDYHLASVDCAPYAFHPKVHLFCGPNVALVGSGNLTPTGLGGYLEAFDRLDAHQDGRAVSAVRDFFLELLEHRSRDLNPQSRAELTQALAQTPSAEMTGDTFFIHNLSRALEDQLQEALVAEAYDELLMISPFHHPRHQTAAKLAQVLGATNVRVAADSYEPPSPTDAFETGVLTDSRPLHAKVIHAKGSEASVLVVGSANLTDSAWGQSKNVEAIVVRQALEPGTFSDWIRCVEFEPKDWSGSTRVEHPRSEELRRPTVSVGWATLIGETLQVGAPDLGGMHFLLESGSERRTPQLSYTGNGVWDGKTPFVPTQAAVVRVSAPGYGEVISLVEQPELLGSTGKLRRLRGLMRRFDAGGIEFDERRDLLAALGDVFAAFRRASPGSASHSSQPTIPTASRPTKSSEPSGQIEEVESLLTAFGEGSSKHRMNRFLEIAQAIGRPRRQLPHRITDVGEVDDPAEDDKSEQKAVEQHEEETRRRDREDTDLVETALELERRMRPQIGELAESSTENALLVHQTLLKLFIGLATSFPKWRSAVVAQLRQQLRDAWAVADWPQRRDGWILHNATASARPQLACEAALICASDLDLDDESSRAADDLLRVLLGVEKVATILKRPLAGAAAEASQAEAVELLGRLRTRRTRGECAHELVRHLWALEVASLREAQLGEPRGRALEFAIERAKGVQLEGGTIEELYFSARPARLGGEIRRVLTKPTDGICPACHMTLPTAVHSAITDPLRVVRCSHCRVLLASGDLEDGRDG